eukprot:49976-Hanusia_phi.AAC.4
MIDSRIYLSGSNTIDSFFVKSSGVPSHNPTHTSLFASSSNAFPPITPSLALALSSLPSPDLMLPSAMADSRQISTPHMGMRVMRRG